MSYSIRHTYSSLLPGTLDRFSHRAFFFETGTNIGKGVEAALSAGFQIVHSVEHDPSWFDEAVQRFKSNRRVWLHFGSSTDVLQQLAQHMPQPGVFYLDAHSIEANPLLDELDAINMSPCKEHVIMIDDVRMFGSEDWHGLHIDQALLKLREINPKYKISFADTAHAANDLLIAELI